MSAVKVLLAGDCLGAFNTLLKKVSTVNAKNGPFDLLLCVGQFFEEGGDEGDIPQDLQPFVDGTQQLPVPTYFLGGYGKGSAATLAALAAAPANTRSLHYLGKSGVTRLEALNVAFLEGTYNYRAFHARPPPPQDPADAAEAAAAAADKAAAAADKAAAAEDQVAAMEQDKQQEEGNAQGEAAETGDAAAAADDGDGDADAAAAAGDTAAAGSDDKADVAASGGSSVSSNRYYNQSDVARLRHTLMSLPGEVDLLLTCEWPAGLLQQLPPGQSALEGYSNEQGSLFAAEMAFTSRPRYHIAGGQNLFYARLPYSNPDLGAGPRATRFVGLGSVTGKLPPATARHQRGVKPARAGVGHGVAGEQQPQQQQPAKQQKFLHALGLPPASSLSIEVLGSLPEGCGACPYAPPTPEGPRVGQKRPAYEHDPIGQTCSWRWMQPRRMRGGPPQQGPPFQAWGKPGVMKDSSRSVFVRNLPYEATYDDLAGFFSQAGQVEDIRRAAQPDSGRPNPWCHVQFTEVGAVPAACALNGTMFMGRPLTIATSTPLNREGPEALLQQQYYQQREAAMALSGGGGGSRGGHSGRGGHGGGWQPRGERRQQQQQRSGQQGAAAVPLEPGKPVEGCWFCLSSEQVDVALVASVGDEAYLALDKGPITPQHCLIIPIEHYPSWVALPAPAAAEAGRYLSALRSAAAGSGQAIVGFERHLKLRSKGGNHTHINTIGITAAAGDEAPDTFKKLAAEAGLTLQEVPAVDGQLDIAALQALVGDGEYFLGLLPDGSGLAANLVPGQKAPMQLGRQILAQLAGCPERADWKACTASSDEEQVAAEAFREWFKPYDFMAAGGGGAEGGGGDAAPGVQD